MKHLPGVLVLIVAASATSCAPSGSDERNDAVAPQTGHVTFIGGYETDPRDHGRPVVLIASALGVSSDVFRDAFSGVTPAKDGPPSAEHARTNKRVLLDALGKHGITNERLDEVSDHYRYRPQSGEVWQRTPATATAIINDGKVTGFEITDPGSGFSTPPAVKVDGYENVNVEVTIEFSTDFRKNGRVTAISVVD